MNDDDLRWEVLVTPRECLRINLTPAYGWKCELFGTEGALTLWREEGKQPNWFWRAMQYLILGNKWSRIDD